ncbi:MAG: AsmA family protein [Pseudomonadota bacterium]
MKRILKIAGLVFGLLIALVIVAAMFVDANSFKPRIAALAKEKGIVLDMRGDLRWAFWPSIGLAVNDLHVASTTAPALPIAELKKASLLVALMPLIRGDVQVKHVLIEGAIIHLNVDAQGKGNWEDIVAAQKTNSTNAQPQQAPAESEELHLQVEEVSLHNSAVHYINLAADQNIKLTDINLDIEDANTEGKPFELSFAWVAELGQNKNKSAPLIVKGKLHNSLTLGEDFNSLSVTNGALTLDIGEKSSATLSAKYSAKVDDLKNNMRYQGEFSLPSFNAKKLLSALSTQIKTANDKALSDISLASKFTGDKKHVLINFLQLNLDETKMDGSTAQINFASSAMRIKLQGDQINVDDYMAPDEVQAGTTATTAKATGDEVILPLDSLRKLDAEVIAKFDKVIFSALTLEKVQFEVEANNGVIKQLLNTNMYGGTIHESSVLDTYGAKPQLRFESIVKNIELAPVLAAKKLDKDLKLSGAIQANASGQAKGVSVNQIMESLTATANFSGAQVRLAPLNIEQQFCRLVNLVNKIEAPEKVWEAYTEMRELSGNITIANRLVTVETFNAGVKKLALNATGKVNLVNNEYDFLLPLKLIKDAAEVETAISTSSEGCSVGSNFWAERGMSLLRCKGSFANMNPVKDCRPDKDALTQLTKDYAEFKLREKHGAKIDAKKAEALKKLDDKLGGEGTTEKAKDLLKNIFKKQDK